MIKPEQIPDEVMYAYFKYRHLKPHKICIAAAINAWPNTQQRVFPAYSMETGHYEVPALVLFMFPPEEKKDD